MRKPTIFGKYLLLERVNVGGMAEVFIAKAFGVEGFERILAIKKILPTMAEDEEVITKAANRSQKTQAGILKGKFGYMSPEQVRGLPIDRRSDVFAVGVILYEMLTGEKLFVGESDFSTLEKVRNAEVASPRQFNPNVPPGLEKVVM